MKIWCILFSINFLAVNVCCEDLPQRAELLPLDLPDVNRTTSGTVQNYSPFHPRNDAYALREAMKLSVPRGMEIFGTIFLSGTDEETIINILGYRSNKQRQEIIFVYEEEFGENLIEDLEDELSGDFESLIEALMMKPRNYDVYSLYEAMSGFGTDEDVLIEILASRSNAEIKEIKELYKNEKGEDLEEEILDETSGHFSTFLLTLANAARNETTTVDVASARADAEALHQAGETKWKDTQVYGTFITILCSRSFPQLRAIFIEYQKIFNFAIVITIEKEFYGDIESGFKAIVEIARNTPAYFAGRLHQAMDGSGTDEDTLTRIVTSRSEIDMVQIKQEFQTMYEKSLSQFVQEDTSGDYEALLLAIIR